MKFSLISVEKVDLLREDVTVLVETVHAYQVQAARINGEFVRAADENGRELQLGDLPYEEALIYTELLLNDLTNIEDLLDPDDNEVTLSTLDKAFEMLEDAKQSAAELEPLMPPDEREVDVIMERSHFSVDARSQQAIDEQVADILLTRRLHRDARSNY
ncbi:hypothetical protein [Caballeronia sp. GACF4]|uniref:hypothetical protein n=1 Tax=Caballeronia sp. GACF4 TaxID=2921763 RepID=UPI0020280233|nr:hypothetical protein [Caballeronia sp. GACF4]